MQCVSGFQPSVQASTSAAQEIKLFSPNCRFFSKIFRMNDSVPPVISLYLWSGICYVIFLFRGPKYIFFIT